MLVHNMPFLRLLPLLMRITASATSNSCASALGSFFTNPSLSTSAGGASACISGNVSVAITANRTNLLLPAPTSQAAATEILQELQDVDGAFATKVVGNSEVLSKTYNIYSRLCIPSNCTAAENIQTVQFLTHGATLDLNYWDIAPNYSYVDAATSAGYGVFSYDRLGTGLSEHPDPIQEVQGPIHVEVAHALVQKLRKFSVANRKVSKVVGVGHSAGSTITQGTAAKYPADFDAVILTGTSTSIGTVAASLASFALEPAPLEFPGSFPSSNFAYLTQAAVPQAVQFSFFRYPYYDQSIFNIIFNDRQTNTLGELITLADIAGPATAYTGPVDILIGAQDFVFCGGNCSVPKDQAALALTTFFPNAKKSSTHYLQPSSGHLVTAHHTAQLGFSQMIGFLKANSVN